MIWREQFIDTNDNAIAGMRVAVLNQHPICHPKSHSPWLTRITDAQGWIECDLDPGEYKIIAQGQEMPLHVAEG